MEEFKAFFNPTQKFEPIIYRGPTIDGLRLTKEDELCYSDRKVEHRHSVVPERTDYSREVKEKETKLYLKNAIEHRKCQSRAGGMESLEHLSTLGASQPNIGELTEEAMTEVYSKYSFQRKEDTKNLSINDYKQDVLDRICGFRVVIIEGPTGCGKTTQVPQWILDDSYQRRKPCKIIVTQPRRIAAISIAKRVAQERGWDVGGLVGYQVGLDNKTTTDSRIMYVTTGVLLQKLVAAKNLNEYTHIILDEVHERGQEMDFLLIVVKKLLFTVSPQVKVILMSATFNSVAFADYFTLTNAKNFIFTSCIKIEKKDPLYTVKTFYLNDLKKFGSALHKAALKDDTPGVSPEMHHLVLKLIDAFERIDMEEDYGHDRSDADIPSVLIFLPGINEIEELYECLTNIELREMHYNNSRDYSLDIPDISNEPFNKKSFTGCKLEYPLVTKKVVDEQCSRYSWWVLPLHSTITADEQARVFQHAPPGKRKIILATNIAESSITVPDIKYVIDYCLMKVLVVDEATNFTSLRLSWAAKSNCDQRAGRAGRVRNGRVYRLVTDSAYERFNDECDPEIKRCPLERLVLLAKMLDMGPPSDVLALAMEPPEISNIHRTILVLKEVGALKKLTDEEWDPEDGEMTYLGRIMARLPLDVRVSKLIVLGHIYGVLDEAVVMAAAMSVKSLFSNPFRERLAAFNSKLTWADGSTSDCITYLNVYKVWRHLRQQQQFKSSGAQAAWARQFFLQVRALRELDDLVRELRARLARDGIDNAGAASVWAKQEVPLVLKMVLAGAFYPQYFVQTSQVEERERDAVRVLGGFNPRNTVYLKDFPLGQPGQIYTSAIKKAVRDTIGEEPMVTVDKNSSKVYLTFQDTEQKNNKMNYDPTIPGQVLLAVYKAVKARQLKMDIRIPILPKEKANQLAQVLEASRALALGGEDAGAAAPRLPDVDDTHIAVKISDMVSVGQFWCQYDDECTPCELRRIEHELAATALPPAEEPAPGDVLVAPYVDAAGTTACRARVLRLLPNKMVEIRYIDYGSFARICASNLRQLPAELRAPPPLAMQCRLAGVAPAPLLDAHGRWAPGALACFNAHVARGKLLAKVYSVAHGVVSLELLANGGTLNINEILVEQGFAVRCEESYESKLNHDLRQTAADLDIKLRRAHNREQAQLAVGDSDALALAPPSRKECVADVLLKGPHSPLEMNVQNLMYAGQEMQVHVEWSSVNSVLLDTAPQELYVRLMVAAEVGQNEANTKLTLRHTTLMPNIPALPAIVALLYCPTTELRRDDEGSRYVSALCGLGSHEDGRPYFAEHDLLVDIDADFTVEDIGLINHVRHLTDYMLYYGDGEDVPLPDDSFRHSVPNLIRADLFKLLNRRRRRREPVRVRRAWEWRSAADDETLEISAPDMLEHTVVYPLHAPQELRPRSREHLLALKRHNDELKMRVSRSSMSSGQLLSCKLCDTVPMSAQAMRLHLFSNTHMEKEEDFLIFRS